MTSVCKVYNHPAPYRRLRALVAGPPEGPSREDQRARRPCRGWPGRGGTPSSPSTRGPEGRGRRLQGWGQDGTSADGAYGAASAAPRIPPRGSAKISAWLRVEVGQTWSGSDSRGGAGGEGRSPSAVAFSRMMSSRTAARLIPSCRTRRSRRDKASSLKRNDVGCLRSGGVGGGGMAPV
jgi:hypothetical protein